MQALLTYKGIPLRGIDREDEPGAVSFFENEKELFEVADMRDIYYVAPQYFDQEAGEWKDLHFEKPYHSNSFHYPVEAKTEDGEVIASGYFTDH